MINLIIFILSFCSWLILVIEYIFKWYTFALSFIWGFFLGQTILGACGMTTIVDLIMK